jgi:uncharacterized lipoprotein YehR (DUF1307 family)
MKKISLLAVAVVAMALSTSLTSCKKLQNCAEYKFNSDISICKCADDLNMTNDEFHDFIDGINGAKYKLKCD